MPPITQSPFHFLEQITELQELPKPEINYLLSKSSIFEVANGKVIFSEGDRADYFYFVMEGKIAMGGCSQAGRESFNCIASRKDLFCCLPTLDKKPYPATAVSVGLSKILRIPVDTFQEIGLRNPVFYQKFVTRVCAQLREIEERHSRRTESASCRIATLLASLGRKSNHPIRLTRAEVAKLVGVTVETAIRILSQLNKKNIIQSRRGLIKIIDREKLLELSELPPNVR